ncbi:hypothetical protein Aperf_G00000000453 [Anoplocephala perfoliata]
MKQHCSRLLASVSSLGKTQEHAPLLLLAAVCGSVFGSTQEELSKASNFAFIVIQELDVFNYLCGILQDRNFSSSDSKSIATNLSDFALLSLPESLSIVSLCSHLAVFDLLTLLARQIAVDSLGEHRTSFTRVLAKTLSVVVQCGCNMSAAESKLSRIELGITSVIEDLAQRFPLDLDLLYICIALLNTGVASNTDNSDEASISNLVVQLISSVPYFAERFPEPSALNELVRVHEPDEGDEEENGEVFVSLLRPHQCFPPIGTLQFSMDKSSSNHMAICLPAGTRDGTVVVWHYDYSIWPVINAIFASAEHTLLNEQSNDQEDVSYAISRLISCLDFVDACLLTNIEPARCLALTELAWTLVTSVFTESLSGERETSIGQTLTTLPVDHLLPCLLRLTAHSVALVDSDNGIVYQLSGSVFSYLQNDRILCPSVGLRNRKCLFTLTDSCFLRIASSANVAPSMAYRLVSSYLDLALSLLSAEKTVFFADAESHFSKNEEEESLARDSHNPLLAYLVFCYEFLIEAGGSPSRRLNIVSHLIAGSPDCGTGALSLVNKALLFFVELLTSYSTDNASDDTNSAMESAPPSLDSPILHFRDLQAYAHWLLSNSESFLNCIISLTKVSIETLQIPLQSIDFDFLCFSTRPNEEQIGGSSALGQHRVQSSWLAITLLHSLFPSHSTSAHLKAFLKALSTSEAVSGAYFLHLLNFLDPACAVGLTRATVSLLKKFIQFSELLVTPHLHDLQPRLLKFFMYRLRSSSADQVTRTALFDWLADAVMQDVLSGAACAPFNGPGFGLLRMISSDDSKVDGLQSILGAALKEVKGEDTFIAVNLYWSLLKLIAAIWMLPNNLFRFQLREIVDFWKLLDDPFRSHMTVLKRSKTIASVVDLEIAGNYATIITIELFEFLESAQTPDSPFIEIVRQFAEEVLVEWIQIAFQLPDGSEPSEFSESSLMKALDWAIIRWKSVFCTLLKWNASVADEEEHLISHDQIVNLVDSNLEKITLWISLPQSRATVSVIDQFAVSLAAAAGYLVSFSETATLPVFEWVHQCVAVLEHSSLSSLLNQQSSSRIFSHFHADLFAFIALLLPEASSPQNLPSGLYERLLTLCLEVFHSVSLLSIISNADSQVFIQAMNVVQLIWKNFNAVALAKCLIDGGIINNLIAILTEHSMTFRGAEFCQAIFRLLTMFLLPVDNENGLYPNLSVVSHGDKSSSFTQKRDPVLLSHSPLTQMLLSYAPDLVQALRLPPVKQMMQWLAQAVECGLNSETTQDEFYPNIPWSEFLLSLLRFLCLLVARAGGSGGEDSPVGHLLRSFILANHEQLSALLTPVPTRGLLISSAVLDLYWTVLHSSNAGTKLSTPTCVASVALFSNGRCESMPLPDSASIYLQSDVWNSIYSSSVQLAGTCATLLLRPEIVDIPKTSSPSSVTGLRPTETVSKVSKLSVSLKLLPILRLLSSSLRLIAVESPMLGDLSFASASEITALTPSATLNFATPSTELSSSLTFGLLFSVARTSSQLLVNISNVKIAADEQICRRRSELLSVLVEVNELAFSLIFSQAVIWMMNPHIEASEKHTLSRGLAVEFQSYNFLARSSRRGRRSLGSHTPIKSTASSPSTSFEPLDSSEPNVKQLQELFTFIDCAERFSELVK